MPPKNKLIVPPGLQHLIKELVTYVDDGSNDPLIICGPSGVGKSLFLHIYNIVDPKNQTMI